MVALYCRVSTEEQAKFGFSIEAQKTALIKYCEEHNLTYKLFVDEGISASSMKRPALQQLLSKCSIFDQVLFTKLDRLSRNVLDANTINKTLIQNNCNMKAIDEDDIDTTTADGMFMFNLKVSLAQREIGKTSERIQFVFKDKRDKGEVTSGKKKYGYDIVDKKYVVNEKEAQNVINLYKYFVSVNGNCSETYNYYIHNFPNKSYTSMARMLREKSFIGLHKLKNKDIYLENYVPKIMDEELFQSVQNLLLKKQPRMKKDIIYMFSGLLYCNECQHRLIGKSQYNYNTYMCNTPYKHLKEQCNNRNQIKESDIEDYLLNNLDHEFKKFKASTKIIKEKKVNTNVIEILNKKLNKLKDLYLDDLIDKDTYKKDYAAIQKKIQEATIEVEVPVDLSETENILNSNWKTTYNKLTVENKRLFWLTIIDKIYINKGTIEIVTFQ